MANTIVFGYPPLRAMRTSSLGYGMGYCYIQQQIVCLAMHDGGISIRYRHVHHTVGPI